MKNRMRSAVVLALALGAVLLSAAGQSDTATAPSAEKDRFDLSLSYTLKFAKISEIGDSRFVLAGGAVDGVYWLPSRNKLLDHLGLAAEVSGEAASNIEPGVDLTQVSFVAGPRLVLWRGAARTAGRPTLYAQSLLGTVFASDSVFPRRDGGTKTNASSLAFEAGGGLNWPLRRRIGVRVCEFDYLFTQLPNNAADTQNDLRLSTGIVIHF